MELGRRVALDLAEPERPVLGLDYDRHAVMDRCHEGIGVGGDDGIRGTSHFIHLTITVVVARSERLSLDGRLVHLVIEDKFAK